MVIAIPSRRPLLAAVAAAILAYPTWSSASDGRIELSPTPQTRITGVFIDQPGSYQLTADLLTTGQFFGIYVEASDVAIDLNGFRVEGTSLGFGGIAQNATSRNLSVRNGYITGWTGSNAYGIVASGKGVTIEDVVVSGCSQGIRVGDGARIAGCRVTGNSGNSETHGIHAGRGALIRDTVVSANHGSAGYRGILAGSGSLVVDSSVSRNTTDNVGILKGIEAGSGSLLEALSINRNGIDGGYPLPVLSGPGSILSMIAVNGNETLGTVQAVSAQKGAVVWRLKVVDNPGLFAVMSSNGVLLAENHLVGNYLGMIAADGSYAVDNFISGHTAAGMSVRGTANRIEANSVMRSAPGISVMSSTNFLGRNIASLNSSNYAISGTNHYGQVRFRTSGFSDWNWWRNHEH